MKIEQVYNIVNSISKEILGATAVVNEDLSNIVDIGKTLLDTTSVDNYVKSLCDHIGKVIFNDRVYSGRVPSVLKDGWEYGSILEKISADIPDATENKSWNLENGTSYDVNVFYKPTVSAKFYNDRVTFEIPMSFTEKQIKSAFSSAEQLNGFYSMIFNSIEKSMTIKLDSLIMRTINNMIGESIAADISNTKITNTELAAVSTNRVVNILKLYNDKFNKTLSAKDCLTDSTFIKFASYTIGLYKDRLSTLSTLFNVGKKERFTPAEKLHTVLLSEFNAAANSYLESEVYHNELVKLPAAEIVPYWQGSGLNYSFDDTSKLDIKIKKTDGKTADIKISGVLGVMFDDDSLGVANLDRRVTTNYNAKGEFFNNWYKMDAGYFNDLNENFIVFVATDSPAA